ncbi:hypothetical protein BDA99DRAFT_497056 [Phascolomyces articulosus]|uniref:Uncharacterized protein n=1 Tax=Phascolomyces articulosus TaxID=60185 RepID=A0AAD5K848_9FUNG|nr:hypothetical protein BDA99DRAFT_497056 [Phascolomyces articulosus]
MINNLEETNTNSRAIIKKNNNKPKLSSGFLQLNQNGNSMNSFLSFSQPSVQPFTILPRNSISDFTV